jgi:hypothetical protein
MVEPVAVDNMASALGILDKLRLDTQTQNRHMHAHPFACAHTQKYT